MQRFPHITHDEFRQGCYDLYNLAIPDCTFLDGEIVGLRFTMHMLAISHSDEELYHESELEPDDEDLIVELGKYKHCKSSATTNVTYDVLLSTSYCVPVLYISANLTISKIYDAIVPEAAGSALRTNGILGALTMTVCSERCIRCATWWLIVLQDHPITGLPVYFVHPCRTAEALRASSMTDQISPKNYLLLWIGIVGSSVGLSIPASAITTMAR